MIDDLIPAVIPIELGSHFLCLVINEILNHCRTPLHAIDQARP